MRISDWSSDVCSSDLSNTLVDSLVLEGVQLSLGRFNNTIRGSTIHGGQCNLGGFYHQFIGNSISYCDFSALQFSSAQFRVEERSEGHECGSMCSFWWSPVH